MQEEWETKVADYDRIKVESESLKVRITELEFELVAKRLDTDADLVRPLFFASSRSSAADRIATGVRRSVQY